ncbi:MAG: ABC transporter permease [Halioglobus sp.]|nr:ABC transporter permease [Halioglobus sp.]
MSKAGRGASLSRTQLGDRYRAWVHHHRLSAADSLRRILDRPFSSLLTWLVIGIALALPVGLSATLQSAQSLSERWEGGVQISVFVKAGVPAETAQSLAVQLGGRGDVTDVRFVSREEALAEFSLQSGLADVVLSLEENPLPDLVLVTPAPSLDTDAIAALRRDLAQLEEVEEAVLDMEWVARLAQLMELGRRVVLVAGALLVAGVVLILGNTIRLAIESRREEIVIVKLVGGSNGFVRRPFLYTGLWYGVGGGLAAAILVAVALWFLAVPVEQLARLYGSGFSLRGPGLIGALNVLLLGGALGLAGAWLAVSRHLSDIEPR